MKSRYAAVVLATTLLAVGAAVISAGSWGGPKKDAKRAIFGRVEIEAQRMVTEGRRTFRYDTYGDEAFWSGQLRIHEALATLTPRQVLGLGVKVDADALSARTLQAIRHGRVNLDDPAVTADLLKQKAVLGVIGSFDANGSLTAVVSLAPFATPPSTIQSRPALATVLMASPIVISISGRSSPRPRIFNQSSICSSWRTRPSPSTT